MPSENPAPPTSGIRSGARVSPGGKGGVAAYVAIARPDHWFKNVFMLLGVVLAFFVAPPSGGSWVLSLALAVGATCLVASSNYVINEILDAKRDAMHPVKRHRPVPSGKVSIPVAYLEWAGLGAVGLAAAWTLGPGFFGSAAALWVAGLAYNVPPVRTKDLPYADVLSESLNNPIRLYLGWFALIPDRVPPLSLTIAYWMAGAFLMGAKRLAEYRMIGDPEVAGAYRSSFRHYTEERLILSLFFYVASCAFFSGVFVVRYHLELLFASPFFAGFFAYYMKVCFKPHSPVQAPEKLYREAGLVFFGCVAVGVFILLLFVEIPGLYDLFRVIPSRVAPLWKF
ncbi:MAG: UbiA prenyltransferase family protein [Deltaproteobacteria bacterium]|nr:UbiA prenyltransferase family protein [Deltaproteobacteria bacterium]